MDGSSLAQRYYITDHLGFTRVVLDKVGTVLERYDYYPYGEKIDVSVASSGNTDYLYTGKESQNALFGINWYDSAARFQTTDGIFTGIDPLAEKYYHISPYAYCAGNPMNVVDPDGKDGIYIVFPDYVITVGDKKYKHLGHAGVLLINNETGLTKYYEYGRYDNENMGIVRNIIVPNVTIGKNGLPTKESLNKTLNCISEKSGQKGQIEGAYIKSDQFDKMNSYAEKQMQDNNNLDREPYSLLSNNCGTFAADVLKQDANVKRIFPIIFIARPISIVKQLQEVFTRVRYKPQKND